MVSNTKRGGFCNDLLSTKVALVTGAGKGLGRASAIALANAGATVIAVARTEEDLLSLQQESNGIIENWVMDANSEEFYQALTQQYDIQILLNNVGSNQPEPFVNVRAETYQRIMDINVGCVFRCSQIVVANLLQQRLPGSIINMSSQMGHVGSPNRTLYCASKHAVEGLTKAMAVELAEQKIRVNTVAPTFVETPLTKPMFEKPEFNEFVMNNIPMRQRATVEDVAAAVVYLASDLSSSVTGTSLRVDGGWTAH